MTPTTTTPHLHNFLKDISQIFEPLVVSFNSPVGKMENGETETENYISELEFTPSQRGRDSECTSVRESN